MHVWINKAQYLKRNGQVNARFGLNPELKALDAHVLSDCNG